MFDNPSAVITGLSGGRKLVAAAGTPVQLSSTKALCVGVVIQALRSNSGNISVGGFDVSGVLGAENGVELVPGQTITVFCHDLRVIWLDADVSAQGVQYLMLK